MMPLGGPRMLAYSIEACRILRHQTIVASEDAELTIVRRCALLDLAALARSYANYFSLLYEAVEDLTRGWAPSRRIPTALLFAVTARTLAGGPLSRTPSPYFVTDPFFTTNRSCPCVSTMPADSSTSLPVIECSCR